MKLRNLICLVALTACLPVNAELFDRGGGLIYDSVLDITWTQQARPGDPSANWAEQTAWVESYVFNGYDDWRLPSLDVNGDGTVINCAVAAQGTCQDNEMGYMYHHNLGGGPSLSGNQGPFLNIGAFHWSSSDWADSPETHAWLFLFSNSTQGPTLKGNNASAWPVRQGDSVPLDSDADGVFENSDNCTLVANADQRDTDNDGFGNICDPDLNNDGIVNFADVALWTPFFNTANTGDEDFNGDGSANFGDYALFSQYFLQSPGPSGLVTVD